MKKSVSVLLVAVLLLLLCACGRGEHKESVPGRVMYGVFDLGTVCEADFDSAYRQLEESYDGFAPACSAIAKTMPDGGTVVARNFDFYVTDQPVYIYHTDIEGFYKTMGLACEFPGGVSRREARRDGLSPEKTAYLLALSADVMNEHGLYIEENMRYGEKYEDGTAKFACSGTNPQSDTRICVAALPQYLAMRCRTVEEVLATVETLDIYSLYDEALDWNIAFMMADRTGAFGVLEIADNEICWHDGAQIQTNFYLEERFRDIEDYRVGYGPGSRYDVLDKKLGACESADDMWQLISSVTYGQTNAGAKRAGFDIRSEMCGESGITYDYITDDANWEAVQQNLKKYELMWNLLPRAILEKKAIFWESTYTALADIDAGTVRVRFFEDDARTLTLSFD